MGVELADVVLSDDDLVTNVHKVDEELSGARILSGKRNHLNDDLEKLIFCRKI